MSLDYIKELGIDSAKPTENDGEVNNQENFVQDSITEESKDTKQDTAPDISGELKKQIEGLEKRIADKDEYINLLREQSKAQEEAKSEDSGADTSIDFWDDPESIVKNMQETIRIQQMQIQETVYANTVENYWKTVNPDALKSAVATDADFAKKFNSSNEPYRVAYEYLSNKNKVAEEQNLSLREQIKAELMKEMGIDKDKPKKEGVPAMGKMGGNSNNPNMRTDVPDDGFAAVFGTRY